MRKSIYLILTTLALVACSQKEIEQPGLNPSFPITSITARINNDTKTAYTIDEDRKKAVFSWAAEDQIDGLIRMGSGSSAYYTGVRFVAQSAGTESEFLDGQIEGDRTVAELLAEDPNAEFTEWAFYPSRQNEAALAGGYKVDWSVKNGKISVDIPSSMAPPVGNPLVVVPLMGQKNASDVYDFTPLTAVLAVPVKNLPDDANFISLASADAALSGSFTFDLGGAVTQSNVSTKDDAGMTLRFSGLSGDYTFYFPLPAGTIPAGLTLTVGKDADIDACMIIDTKKALDMQTGVITRTPALTFTPVDQQWEYFAEGSFLDDFLWGQHSAYTANTWVPVTIERSGLHPEKYRINNPYTVANSQFGYTPYTSGVESDDYFEFYIEDGALRYTTFRTGVEDKDSGGKPMMITYSKLWSSSKTGEETKVISSMSDGTPVELQFGAIYSQYENPGAYMYTRDGEGNSSTQRIHLKFNWEEDWNSIGTCTFIDNKIWPFAGLTDPVEREIQQSSVNPARFRIARPYPADDADEWFVFDTSDPNKVTSEDYYTGVTVTRTYNDTQYSWKAVVVNGAYNYTYCTVMSTQRSGLPLEVQIGPCYRDSEGIFINSNPRNYGYEIGGDQSSRVIDIIFPHPEETWTSLGIGRYMDEWFWKNNTFAPYNVEVEIWRSDLDENYYRVANPYTVANTAFKRTAISGADEYLYLTVDPSTGLVFYETLKTGMDRSGSTGRNLAAAHPTTWNALKGTSLDASTTKVAAGTAAAPLEIQMAGVYYDSADNTHFYTNSTGLKHLWFPGYDAGETWAFYCEGTYQDVTYDAKINGTDAIGTVSVTIEQSSFDSNRFRVANPYRANVNASYLKSTYDEYLYFQLGNGRLYFEPFRPGVRMDSDPKELGIWHPVNSNLMGYSQGSNDFTGSSVLSTNSDGTPSKVQLGAHYFDIATPDPSYCYTRHGSAWPNDRIYITFGSADKLDVTHYGYALKTEFHNPIAKLSLPNGTLEKLVVKISGIDLSKVTGLRLYQGGWMESNYVAPDASGVVTMTSFTNATVSSDIDLNFWMTGSVVGEAVHFEILEVVMGGVSLPIVQEDAVHLGGIVVNTGGDVVNVRGTSETVSAFRIPALVTTNSGALIAAYDVRYASSADLQGDIDVGMKRSTDGGKTWSDLQLIMDMGEYGGLPENQNGIGDPCLLVDENTGDIFCFAVWAHDHAVGSRALSWASTGFGLADTPQLMMVRSTDDGLTWSAPVNLTQQVKQYDWRMTFQGPGRGITMADGTLVIPFQHQVADGSLTSGIMYSTDHGYNWHVHNAAHPVTSEAAVAEIEPGVLLLTMRDETNSHARRNFVTSDLGRTWEAHVSNGQLIEPTCEASLIHVNASANVLGQDLLLFSNPHSTSGRDHITIQASLDKGVTWNHSLLVDEGGSWGYTCLTMVDNATVGILYESSRGNIFFQAVPLTEIVPAE